MSFLTKIFGFTEKKEPVVDYNTLKIKSVSALDEFEKIKLKNELDVLYEKIKTIAASDTIEQKERHVEKNDVCPNCTSTEITHRIETSSKSSGYGKYSSTESVKTKINVCGKCYEEWEHNEFRAYTTSKYELAENIIRFLRYYHEEKHTVEKVDPNSLETHVADSQNKIINGHWAKEVKKYMDGCSVELAKYLVEVKEQYCATVGKLIHKKGKLHNIYNTPLTETSRFEDLNSGNGGMKAYPVTITPVYKDKELKAVKKVYLAKHDEHRESEKKVNWYKAKIKNEMTEKNAAAQREYADEMGAFSVKQAEYNQEKRTFMDKVRGANEKLRATCESRRQLLTKDASALKIFIPENLRETKKFVQNYEVV